MHGIVHFWGFETCSYAAPPWVASHSPPPKSRSEEGADATAVCFPVFSKPDVERSPNPQLEAVSDSAKQCDGKQPLSSSTRSQLTACRKHVTATSPRAPSRRSSPPSSRRHASEVGRPSPPPPRTLLRARELQYRLPWRVGGLLSFHRPRKVPCHRTIQRFEYVLHE